MNWKQSEISILEKASTQLKLERAVWLKSSGDCARKENSFTKLSEINIVRFLAAGVCQ